MIEGFWQQHELWDGTYSFEDLLDIHEVLDLRDVIKAETQRTAEKLSGLGRH